jgi:proteic killer suppression protein
LRAACRDQETNDNYSKCKRQRKWRCSKIVCKLRASCPYALRWSLMRATCQAKVRDDTDDPPQRAKRLFEQDDPSGVNPEHAGKLRNILATLQAAPSVAHMDLPGFRLHQLKGERKAFWAVTVRANWRVIFRFDDGVEDVDYH